MKDDVSFYQNAFSDQPGKLPEIIDRHFTAIESLDSSINSFTQMTKSRAAKQTSSLSQSKKYALAGVPFAVKNLFDIKNEVTPAGSKINNSHEKAKQDAVLIERLEREGAILMGALNMGEYAYDFTGENSHFGNCSNPFDLSLMSGGSSSGSGAAVAAGLVNFSLGSDTNGSIRVPSSFCGLFGLKPTYGRLPRTGTFPFSDSLDHLGPIARTTSDLSRVFDCLQGYDENDHACRQMPTLKTQQELSKGIDNLKIAKLGGYFDATEFPQAENAVNKIYKALNIQDTLIPEGVAEGRSAAYIITNAEGSSFHLPRLQQQPESFDPDTRDRFLAGAMLPAHWYINAQKVRLWFQKKMLKLFKTHDLLIAPATPCVAPKQGQKTLVIRGEEQLLRPNLGYFTQPFSAIGLPTVVVPTIDDKTNLPIGVQIVAAPWREDLCLRAAAYLEDLGFKFQKPSNYFSVQQNEF